MTSIQGLSPARATASPNGRTVSANTGFTVPKQFELSEPLTATVEKTGLVGMLILQESAGQQGAGITRDRHARGHGGALLAALAALQRGLLITAEPDLAALHDLANLVQASADATDPGLQRIVAEIRLRAHIELARYDSV